MRPRPVCLLTGAAGRLGTAFCRAYAGAYAIAAVHHRAPLFVPSQHGRYVDPLQASATLPENAHPVFAIQADLEQEDQLEKVVRATLEHFGKIDLLVNLAYHSVWQTLLASERMLADMERQFRMNVAIPARLAVLCAHAFWASRPAENAHANRSIVNLSSTSGLRIYPAQGQSVYAASKAALNHLTRHMAHEFADFGVRVNAVAPTRFPGLVATERVALAIHQCATGHINGAIYAMDVDGERLL